MSDKTVSASPLLVRLDASPQPSVQLKRALTIVGSKRHSHLRIISSAISGSHALFLNLGNNVFLRDLMSRTHVYVNDQEITEYRLKYGDIVRFGEMRFRFVDANVLRQSLSSVRPPPAKLYRELDGEHLTLDKPMLVIGRHAGADLVLEGAQVSKAHVVIYEHDGQRMIRALGSRDGMLVNESAIRSARLQNGDTIRIGTTLLHYVTPDGQTTHAEPDEVDAADNTNDSQSPLDSHTFVCDPVIIPSSTAFIDTEPAELTEASAPHQFTNSLALPGDWELAAETSAPIETQVSSSSAPIGIGAAEAESPAELAESTTLEALESSRGSDDISAKATSASSESAESSLSEPVQLETLTPTLYASPPAAIGVLDVLESDSLGQGSPAKAAGEKQESRVDETLDATFEPSHFAEPRKSRGSRHNNLRVVGQRQATANVGEAHQDGAPQSNLKGLDDILATEILTLHSSSILEDAEVGASPDLPSRSRRIRLLLASALAALAVSGAGVWYYLHHR